MAAPVKLAKGTIEQFPIKVSSALGTLTTLTGKDLRFDVYKADDEETVVALNMSSLNSGMIALPLVDTTAYTEGLYKMFIHFSNAPETPRLGPFYFIVGD